MHVHYLLPLASLLTLSQADETVLGVYIFSRHGDRTAKSTPPTNLTDLGYREIFDSGTWFRNSYVSSNAPKHIAGINTDIVKLSQIAASAPLDNVLMSSAHGFLQGLYPPVGPQLGSDKLRNGTVIEAPLNGYQIVPVQTVTSGTNSEDSSWLQGAGNCANALVSSNNYYASSEYTTMLHSTRNFYDSLSPVINATFNSNQTTFYNAYTSTCHSDPAPIRYFCRPFAYFHTVFDLINVAEIHNATIPSSDLLTNDTLFQLRTLADNHEFNLAYNASDPIRAIAGATFAAQVVQGLNRTISSRGKTDKINIQFGAYNSFQSFFGLTKLTSLPGDNGTQFFGVPDYASTMTFELFTTAPATPFPAVSDLQVRFLFHNGTTGNSSTPQPYPLFGSSSTDMSWDDFVNGMGKFSVGSQSQWCTACGNTTGVCASQTTMAPGSKPSTADGSGNGVSPAVGGVIGAMVTLAVILLVEALIMLLAGLRLVRKNRLINGTTNEIPNGGNAKE